jgi:hypothetical protein
MGEIGIRGGIERGDREERKDEEGFMKMAGSKFAFTSNWLGSTLLWDYLHTSANRPDAWPRVLLR